MSEFYDLAVNFLKGFEELKPLNFYREIFPCGSLQRTDESNNLKYNAIACEFLSSGLVRRYTLFDDDFESKLDTLLRSENFVIMSPISYVGKQRTAKNARDIYALCFDLDGVNDENHLDDLLHQASHDIIPMPNYIAVSGNGLHLYYQFEIPVPCFPNIVHQLARLRKWLTRLLWNRYLTTLYQDEKVQYQSLFQGFRLVGGVTKDFAETGNRERVFRTSSHPISLEYLNRFAPEEFKIQDIQYKSEMTLQQAKEKYPDWYERKILKQEKKRTWPNKRALYDWWKGLIAEKTVVGHRYYCIMCLAIYAKKCEIPFEELKKDADSFLDQFESMTKGDDNHFTKKDIKDALKAYKDDFKTYPINSIIHDSGIQIQKNKRNGRKQSVHLRMARAIQQIQDEENGTKWNGRKSAEGAVLDYIRSTAEPSCRDFCEKTGLKKSVYYKYKPKN